MIDRGRCLTNCEERDLKYEWRDYHWTRASSTFYPDEGGRRPGRLEDVFVKYEEGVEVVRSYTRKPPF